MNTNWLKLSKERRVEILNQVTDMTGLPAQAIEKDWWVTLCLRASFSLPYSRYFVFKGGTSLSKGWDLIERFSEDIDLAIDRRNFGFDGEISKEQIRKLRKQSCEFTSTVFLNDLSRLLTDWNLKADCELIAQPVAESDKDPQVIEIQYNSVVDTSQYLPQRVLIEVSARSMMEPAEKREINSILALAFPQLELITEASQISTVLPQRTFLEKIFLLHEEFSRKTDRIRSHRMSRHLYDLERLMDTEYGLSALKDLVLFNRIVAHREKLNPIRGIDYGNHAPSKIRITPPDEVLKEFENDYTEMTRYMIYGKPLKFVDLLKRVSELQVRINSLT